MCLLMAYSLNHVLTSRMKGGLRYPPAPFFFFNIIRPRQSKGEEEHGQVQADVARLTVWRQASGNNDGEGGNGWAGDSPSSFCSCFDASLWSDLLVLRRTWRANRAWGWLRCCGHVLPVGGAHGNVATFFFSATATSDNFHLNTESCISTSLKNVFTKLIIGPRNHFKRC